MGDVLDLQKRIEHLENHIKSINTEMIRTNNNIHYQLKNLRQQNKRLRSELRAEMNRKIKKMGDEIITQINNEDDEDDDGKIIIMDITSTDNNKLQDVKSVQLDPLSALMRMFILESQMKQLKNNNNDNDDSTIIDNEILNDVDYIEITESIENINDLITLAKKLSTVTLQDNKKYPINIKILNNLITPLEKLNNLVGLTAIKKSILNMILYYLQEFDKKEETMLHTVIMGPPGVGKTECGKILAEIYANLGVIPSNKFTLVKRTDLIGEYLGHTAQKTQKVIDEANGGVLFIDEAYSLGNQEKRDSYSKECIDTLNQNLTEKKKKLIVIIAGYEDELESSFFSYNPGLKRRFPFRYSIEGYNADELTEIFVKKIINNGWQLINTDSESNSNNITDMKEYDANNKCVIELCDIMNKKIKEIKHYGGDIENIFTLAKFIHSRRVFGLNPSNRKKLTIPDIEKAFDEFIKYKKTGVKIDDEKWRSMYV